jgi:hypothetical protein
VHAVLRIHEWHYLIEKKSSVAIGPATPQSRRLGRRIFLDSRFSDVVNPNNNQRLDTAGANFGVGAMPDVPILPLHERSRPIKKILSVMHVKDRKPAVGLLLITRRQIHHKVPLIAQNF